MKEKTAEEISMLMDNELDEHSRVRVINMLKNDDEMKSCWEHYHLISDALRNNLPEVICPDLANRISNILNQEPNQVPQQIPAQAVPHKRAVTGLALAASLAVIAVVGLLQINNQNELPGQQLMTKQEEAAIAPEVMPAAEIQSQTTVASLPLSTDSSQLVDLRVEQAETTPPPAVNTRLYDYLIHHNEYAVTMPVQGGMVPYARMVGYASDE